jgi:hypothetical protein
MRGKFCVFLSVCVCMGRGEFHTKRKAENIQVNEETTNHYLCFQKVDHSQRNKYLITFLQYLSYILNVLYKYI